MRLLLVEDDRMIGASLRQALRAEGHAVDWVYDAAAAHAALAAERFDLVLLDLGLPAPASAAPGSSMREAGAGLVGLATVNGDVPPPVEAEAEAAQLRMRVIALENLVISLLADATDEQRVRVREMAGHISPRPGYTPHPLTLRAADAMRSLLDRADRFRPGGQA